MSKDIYIIRAGEYTKIGVSSSPKGRVKEIQPCNPLKCELVNEISCEGPATSVEATLHNHFFPHTAEGGREWFRLPDEEYEELLEIDHLDREDLKERFPNRVPGRVTSGSSLYKSDYNHYPIRMDGREQCVSCGEVFGGEDAAMDEVHEYGPVTASGRMEKKVKNFDPGEPLMHPECYEEWFPRSR